MARFLIALTLLAVAGCSSASPASQEAPTAATAAPTTAPAVDPGVTACKASAAAQRARLAQGDDAPLPSEAQRKRSWERYQASRYANLRDVGDRLERAWYDGDLAEQMAASVQLILACSLHGVEIPT